MSILDLKVIKERLAQYEGACRVIGSSHPERVEKDKQLFYYHAATDIAALVARVEELEGEADMVIAARDHFLEIERSLARLTEAADEVWTAWNDGVDAQEEDPAFIRESVAFAKLRSLLDELLEPGL